MYLRALIFLSIVYSIHSTTVEPIEQGTCGCYSRVPGPVGPKGDTGIKGSTGHKGEKGDVGLTSLGLQGVPGRNGLQGATGEKGEKGEKAKINKSAFFVAFEKDPGKVPGNSPTKYEKIITNIGSHYNKITGKFVCQYPGTYVFHFSSRNSKDGLANTKIMKNGAVVASSTSPSSDRGSFSNMAVINLVAGDEVWAEASNWNNYFSTNWRHCTFSGFLLYPA